MYPGEHPFSSILMLDAEGLSSRHAGCSLQLTALNPENPRAWRLESMTPNRKATMRLFK